MKLKQFLADERMANYRPVIGQIQEEFIKEGCEKHLFVPFKDEMASMEKTKSLLKKYQEKPNEYVDKFLKQFEGLDIDNNSVFIFPENNSSKFYMARELSKRAKETYIIENLIPTDDTINWLVVVDNKDADLLVDLYHVVYSSYMSEPYGGYKMFGLSLIYFGEMLEYKGVKLRHPYPNPFVHFQGYLTRRDNNPFVILQVRKVVKKIIEDGYFENEMDLYLSMYNHVFYPMQKLYGYARDTADMKGTKEYKERLERLRSELVASGVINGKWKNEQSLFKIVAKMYPDAIFQHRPDWLSPQSLDIFIPSLNIGIEYQGLQHYENVDFFGGEEGFQKRKVLDATKKQKCEDNSCRIIYWPYTDPVTKTRLIERIDELQELNSNNG